MAKSVHIDRDEFVEFFSPVDNVKPEYHHDDARLPLNREYIANFLEQNRNGIAYSDEDFLMNLLAVSRHDPAVLERVAAVRAKMNSSMNLTSAEVDEVINGLQMRNFSGREVNMLGITLGKLDLSQAHLGGDINLHEAQLGVLELSGIKVGKRSDGRVKINSAKIGNVRLEQASITSIDMSGAAIDKFYLDRSNIKCIWQDNASIGKQRIDRAEIDILSQKGGRFKDIRLSNSTLKIVDQLGAEIDHAVYTNTTIEQLRNKPKPKRKRWWFF